MAYSIVAAIRARLPLITAEIQSDALLTDYIAQADAEIDARLRASYAVPFPSPDSLVRYISLEHLGFGVVWGVLDARWFGIPQTRRRLFVVGRAGRCCSPQVLAPSPDSGIPAEPGKGAEPAARTLTRMYRMCVADRLSVGFVPAGTFIRACPHPHRVREVDGLFRWLDPARIDALGNAVCVPIARALGENIKRIMEENDGDRYQERRIQGGDQS